MFGPSLIVIVLEVTFPKLVKGTGRQAWEVSFFHPAGKGWERDMAYTSMASKGAL